MAMGGPDMGMDMCSMTASGCNGTSAPFASTCHVKLQLENQRLKDPPSFSIQYQNPAVCSVGVNSAYGSTDKSDDLGLVAVGVIILILTCAGAVWFIHRARAQQEEATKKSS